MRLTIERMRTLVLAAGVLLVVALGVFLAVGRIRSPFSKKDIPKRLGIDIEQEANGVTYTQAHGGHTLFKIHASKVVQLKNDHALLHDVQIELYGADGSRVDRIAGSEFEYDQKDGMATAKGPVEITLMRPNVAPAVAPKASAAQMAASKGKQNPLAAQAAGGEIHVETSGLTFDQKSQVATTDQRVEFSMTQGSGSAMGAIYDSQRGFLSLNHAVVLKTQRGADPVEIHASYADFDRDSNVCDLSAATAEYRGGQATAADAKVLFREDGTAERLYATGGFTLATATGGHIAAPKGTLDFDEHNQPHHGRMEGGVTMDSTSGPISGSASSQGSGTRTTHGTSPAVEIEFTGTGQLHALQMADGVELASEESGQATVKGQMVPDRSQRTWRSPSAHVEFRDAGKGQVEPASIEGGGGVTLTTMDRRGDAAPSDSKLTADAVTGAFRPASTLTEMTGVGHASMEQTGSTGTRDTATGDRLDAHFAQTGAANKRSTMENSGSKTSASGASVPGGAMAGEVESATLDGHVTLTQQPAPKPGAQQPPAMRAAAAHAAYEGAGEWLHLTGSPRVVDGALEMTADKIDVSQQSGDAFAHGDVKATWMNGNDQADGHQPGTRQAGVHPPGMTLGGQGPAHVVAAEAELHQSTGDAVFRGNARLWQQWNSVSAPVIEINRPRQTLTAESRDRANPVRAVLVSAGKARAGQGEVHGDGPGKPADQNAERVDAGRLDSAKSGAPAVVRVRGGDLRYSDAERRARMDGGVLGAVTAETGAATTVSDAVDLELTPAGARAAGQSQVQRMTATGHVVVSSQGRRGTGEQLVYTGADGSYVLTGTAAAPPVMTDPQRGSTTGEALIFHSRDDSVSIEGGTQETRTETTAPR